MPDNELSRHRAQLEALRAAYVEKLPETFERLEALIDAIPTDPSDAFGLDNLNASLGLLYQEAHKLAGTSGSLGLEYVSTAARQLLSLAEN